MKILILSLFLMGCTCSYHVSKLKEKGCWKDSVRVDTIVNEKEVLVLLPQDTIRDSIPIEIEGHGRILDIPYRNYHKGVYNLKIGVYGGKVCFDVWGDTIYKTTVKDTVIYKTKIKYVETKKTKVQLLKENWQPLLYIFLAGFIILGVIIKKLLR
jgi:hypothetical protein